MNMLLILSGLAAALVWIGGRFQKPDLWLRFLFISLAGLLGVTGLALLAWPAADFTLAGAPAAASLLAALVVYGTAAEHPLRWNTAGPWIGVLVIGALLAGLWLIDQGPVAVLIISTGGLAGLAWQAPGARGRWRVLAWAGLLGAMLGGPLLWLMVPEVSLAAQAPGLSTVLQLSAYWLWPVLAVVQAGRLVYAGLAVEPPRAWPARAALLLGAGVILAVVDLFAAQQLIWDWATDGLMAIGIVTMAIFPAAVAAGALLAWALPGWRKLSALLFLAAAPVAAYQMVSGGWPPERPLALTSARAAVLAQAIETYHSAAGRYPAALTDLPVWYSWRLYEPVIYRDETWCYEGGGAYFRLGYVHRPAFGVPAEYISVKLAASAGTPPTARWSCDERAEAKQRAAPVLP
ncbi:MAG: hypothetical protein KA764_03245 [Anaerolineales bacterium]|nr:hypothetical protein [Anaerolineales bacterium]